MKFHIYVFWSFDAKKEPWGDRSVACRLEFLRDFLNEFIYFGIDLIKLKKNDIYVWMYLEH